MFSMRWLLADLKQRIQAAVVNAARNSTASTGFGNDRHPPVVVVDLQLPLYSLTLKGLPQAKPALQSLEFAPPLRALSDKIVQRMISGEHIVSERGFNGLHLRSEKDNTGSHKRAGGMKAFMDATYSTCKLAGLNTSMPLYVATGLLTSPRRVWPGQQLRPSCARATAAGCCTRRCSSRRRSSGPWTRSSWPLSIFW